MEGRTIDRKTGGESGGTVWWGKRILFDHVELAIPVDFGYPYTYRHGLF